MNSQVSRTRRWWWLILLPLLLAPVVYWWLGGREAEPPPVTTPVVRGDVEDLVTATGRLRPRNYVDVGAQVSGQLTHIHVEVGDQVEAGQLLAEIDSTVYLASVDAARAQLRNQQAQLDDRRAQVQLAEMQYRRQQELHGKRMTSDESLQVAETTLRSARAQLRALEAQIEQTQSTLRADEARLDYARIYAPMEGTVVSISARQGQTLNASQQAPILLQIADLSMMTVQAQVSEADITRLSTGMPAYFTTLGNQHTRWRGALYRIEPTPEVQNNVVLYNALFDVNNEDNQLLPQMTAQVFFIVAEARDALLVPAAAVRMLPGREASGRPAEVTVRHGDGRLETRRIVTGVSNRVQVQVVEGVSEGEQLLLERSASARPSAAGAPPMRMMR